jgi:hypothetical protein
MEKNQQDRLLGVNRELGEPPEGRVTFEVASQGYEFSSEESEGEENNREVEDDPPDSSSPEGREPILLILLHIYFSSLFYFFETMYIGDKGLAQASRVTPLEFKASLFS